MTLAIESPLSNQTTIRYPLFSAIDTTPASSSVDERFQSSTCSMLTLPNETLFRILEYTMASEVPFHLEKFVQFDRASRIRGPPCDQWSFPDLVGELHRTCNSQKEHYVDWVIVNSVGHRIRACGVPVFFSQRLIIITTMVSSWLQDNTCRMIVPRIRAAIFSQARNLIAAIPTHKVRVHLEILPAYNAFRCLRSLVIEIYNRDFSDEPQSFYRTTLPQLSPTPMPASDFCEDPMRRYTAPRRLVRLLEKIGLQVERLDIEVLYEDTNASRRLIPLEFTRPDTPGTDDSK